MTITLQIDTLTVTAEITNGHATVTSAKNEAGQEIHVTPDHLDAWEGPLFEAVEDQALCAYWDMLEDSDVQGYARRCYA